MADAVSRKFERRLKIDAEFASVRYYRARPGEALTDWLRSANLAVQSPLDGDKLRRGENGSIGE